jgi:Ni,Fe-hydrogenase I small subunit
MVRITRRDFLKYCAMSAGALGLSASTLMRLESVLAKTYDGSAFTAVPVIWIAGAACTGCTMSLANSVSITTVDSLLIDTIDLKFIDTLQSTAGAYVNSTQYSGANALKAAQDVYNSGEPYVLAVEGAIQTGQPAGGSAGDFCKIGSLTAVNGPETMMDNVTLFAQNPNCLAILSIGTCSSFGGVPGAKGNVTGAKGVGFTGTRLGGALIGVGTAVSGVSIANGGSGYETTPPTVAFVGGGASTAATGTANVDVGITSITSFTNTGTYAVRPNVVVTPPPGYPTDLQATAMATTTSTDPTVFTLDGIVITYAGTGYTPGAVNFDIIPVGSTTPTDTGVADASGYVSSVTVTSIGAGYTSAPAVELTGGSGTGAQAAATLTLGATVDDMKNRTGLAAKLINISGCPPHPDWIVGTLAYVLDYVPQLLNGTASSLQLPDLNRDYQPIDYGYGGYQCNAGPCPWRYNNTDQVGTTGRTSGALEHNRRYPTGNSRALGVNKYEGTDLGCLGILGCKGRKTKADCSARRWNADGAEQYGVNWCVGSRGSCHGCTQPAFPDKVGKFFTFA